MHFERLLTSDLPSWGQKLPFSTENTPSYEDCFPKAWSIESQEAFKQTFASSIPEKTKTKEENTVPSWLWQSQASGSEQTSEHSAYQVFARLAGGAAYKAWKKNLFQHEDDLKAFYDEAFILLCERLISFDASTLTRMGLNWAYGLDEQKIKIEKKKTPRCFSIDDKQATKAQAINVSNKAFDAIVALPASASAQNWEKLFVSPASPYLSFHFTDTLSEWGSSKDAPSTQLVLDLMAFRKEEGGFNTDLAQHALRLGILLIDLLFNEDEPQERNIGLGFVNLSSFLMAEATPYDSPEGRALASAMASFISAESTLFSAKLAILLGPSPSFINNRDTTLRKIRNRRRASYGEKNDYEHLSVLPARINISACEDLVLISKTQRLWDQAEDLAHKNGLRYLDLASMPTDPFISVFLESAAPGVEPEPTLVHDINKGDGTYRKEAIPSVAMGLTKLGCDPSDVKAILDHIVGYNSLIAAPSINHATLKERGFTDDVLERLENYLPEVKDIRFAATPWILGISFCKDVLNLSSAQIDDPVFDILSHVGFSEDEIKAANAFCCGHETPNGAQEMPSKGSFVFQTKETLSAEAQIQMAAAVQSFMEGAMRLTITAPNCVEAHDKARLVLLAWRSGLKDIHLFFENFKEQKAEQEDLLIYQKPKSKKILKRSLGIQKPPTSKPSAAASLMPPTSVTLRGNKAKAKASTISLAKVKKPSLQKQK